ncbi:hypothetical protein EXIGLDRAFT_760950 [Exidia glandulosa HHB12029]|uniref:FAD/NAD(P)-binding domain-containing protein n=1 Tax=Exidia glandulosa HHB12029 TaxID=1314781 RepID=A0A165NT94_EXIGL|nr:hypothetical protein EXIGLDRAFT_760950 [Exidia glandulosa HHB12029]
MLSPNLVLLAASLLAAFLVVQGYLFARRRLRAFLLRTFTTLPDLENVGRTRAGGKLDGTAVVCGGSFAGLFTARICADHFSRVVLVEPELFTFTEAAKSGEAFATRTVHDKNGVYKTLAHKRSRVYQYASTHVVQVLLTRFLRAVFPDFNARAESSGARVTVGDLHLHIGGRALAIPIKKYTDYAHQVVFASRRNLETLVRRAVCATCPSIEFVQGFVTEFKILDSRVTAVSVRGSDGTITELACELVADCTGNTQAGLKCLTRALPTLSSAGLRRDEYNPKLNFTSFEFPVPDGFEENLRALGIRDAKGDLVDMSESSWFHIHGPDPDLDYRTIFLGRSDFGRSGVGGWDSEVPVTLEGLREYMSRVIAEVPIPAHIFQIFDLLEPVKDQAIVFPAKCSSCSRIYYERVSDELPQNFVAVGDAMMRLNPRTGEGVTKCALGALTLDGVLRDASIGKDALTKTYFKRMTLRTGHLWDASKWADYGRDTTVPVRGETLEEGALFRWFFGQLNRVLPRDEKAAEEFWKNLNFLSPPTDMASPSIVAKVLLEGARSLWSEKA